MIKSIFLKLFICGILASVLLVSFWVPSSYAIGDIFSEGKDFLKEGNSIGDTINEQALKRTSDYIYNALLGFAIMLAVIIAMVLGIQFMFASADEKAKVKEALMPFIVGCVVVFGSFTIWKVVVNIGNDAEGPKEAVQYSNDYKLIDEIDGELEVDSEYLKKMNDSELKRIYSEIINIIGPFSEDQQKIIQNVIDEYNERFNN